MSTNVLSSCIELESHNLDLRRWHTLWATFEECMHYLKKRIKIFEGTYGCRKLICKIVDAVDERRWFDGRCKWTKTGSKWGSAHSKGRDEADRQHRDKNAYASHATRQLNDTRNDTMWGHFVSVRVFFFLFSSALKGPVRGAFIISSTSGLVFFFGSRLHQHLHLLSFLWGLFWHFLYFLFFRLSYHSITSSYLLCFAPMHAMHALLLHFVHILLCWFWCFCDSGLC